MEVPHVTIHPDHRQWAGPIPAPSAEQLTDIHAVSELVKVYALGVDMRDFELVCSVFDPDGSAEGALGAFPMSEYLPRIFEGASAYHATQHNITNQYVTVDGDEARIWSYAVCYHLEEVDNGRDDLVVAVQYRDVCRRHANGWLIASRAAVVQWMRGPFPRPAN
jgi:hypothetical protein